MRPRDALNVAADALIRAAIDEEIERQLMLAVLGLLQRLDEPLKRGEPPPSKDDNRHLEPLRVLCELGGLADAVDGGVLDGKVVVHVGWNDGGGLLDWVRSCGGGNGRRHDRLHVEPTYARSGVDVIYEEEDKGEEGGDEDNVACARRHGGCSRRTFIGAPRCRTHDPSFRLAQHGA